MTTLNIIGAGKVARVLARLWTETGHFSVQQVLNRSLASGRQATEFMGGGEAVSGWERLRPADVWLLGTPDDLIWETAHRLSRTSAVGPSQAAFHLSGARDSSTLSSLSDEGLTVASLHPLKSIPDVLRAYQTFADTWCALEGDDKAVSLLEQALTAISALPFRIRGDQKILYHAGNALLCNYLITLLDVGLKIYEMAGIPNPQALKMVAPMMQDTLSNGLELGPQEALTGPIIRGDLDVVRTHINALPPFARNIYRELGLHTVEIAHESGQIDEQGRLRLLKLFDENSA